MSPRQLLHYLKTALIYGLVLVGLQGCLSQDEPSTTTADPTPSIRLNGSVGDGPVVSSIISVYSQGGALLVQGESDSTARYDLLVDAVASDYPLSIESAGGLDLVSNRGPDFSLQSVATATGVSTIVNINPISTLVVEIARVLPGGLNTTNVSTAMTILNDPFDFGLVSLDTNGAMYAAINGNNIAEIIRASEAMAEAVRRTRDRLVAADEGGTGDSVVAALAADLSDGILDGRGSSGVDARASALLIIAVAEVLLESMQAELHVYGVNALDAMNSAADTVNGAPVDIQVQDLPVTDSMIQLAAVSIDAASAVTTDGTFATIASALDNLQAGVSAEFVGSVIPTGYRSSLDALASFVATADQSTIDTINDVAGGRSAPGDPGNQAPTIVGTPTLSVTAGDAYVFQPTAADPDQDVLTFSISGRPAWASFDSTTGRLAGTPTESDVGSYAAVQISVSDGSLTSLLPAFTLTVNSATSNNAIPQISGQPSTEVTAGDNYIFVPTASDADGDTLSFSIQNIPSWAGFNPANGALSGSPTEGSVGTYTDIRISVSDGSATASLPPFSITVQTAIVPNSAPTISGTPSSSVREGQTYVFVPSAADSDGDTLTFSISGQPSWTTFDTATGRLTGTPADTDVGTYSNIVISVSDGVASTSLPPFSITVDAMVLGSATLSWSAPTENTDDTALTNLAGFRVYWGTTAGNYTNSLTIDNPGQTMVVVDNLEPGTYTFVATAFNDQGVESAYSNPTVRTIQ